MAARRRLLSRFQTWIDHRRSQNEKGIIPKDLLQRLMDGTTEEGEKLSDAELKDSILIIIFAGSDTSMAALNSTFYILARNECTEFMQNLREEIHSIPATPEEGLNYEILDRLPYLDAFVKETLRMWPPVGVSARVAIEDIQTDSGIIPKDSLFVLSIRSAASNAESYNDPGVFRPERFLPGGDGQRGTTFPVFGVGPRMCVGMNLAKLELKMFVFMLTRHFSYDVLPEFKQYQFPLNRLEAKLTKLEAVTDYGRKVLLSK